jgi:hypothetical protein
MWCTYVILYTHTQTHTQTHTHTHTHTHQMQEAGRRLVLQTIAHAILIFWHISVKKQLGV